MLTDEQIDGAEQALADFRQDDALTKILDRYGELLEDYKTLKSEYEEARESRERYKKLSKGQERGQYVVVLVDGDGYIFQDDFVRKGTEDGGGDAARALNRAIKAKLEAKNLSHCQVLVRIYANVAGLSKALSRAGLCGAEKRSITPFIADFNRSFGNTDFVDAGELKENADFKLRDQLHHHINNTQCKHIFFAACHDVGYIAELTPHKGDREKFTLVSSPGINFHQQFDRLNMNVEGIPGIFRTTSLDPTTQHRAPLSGLSTNSKATTYRQPSPSLIARIVSPVAESSSREAQHASKGQEPCRFFPLGKCKYGNSCIHAHVLDRSNSSSWRDAKRGISSVEDGTSTLSDGRQYQRQVQRNVQDTNGNLGGDNIDKLPKQEDIPADKVAVNSNNYRLDPYIVPVSASAQTALHARIKRRPVCNRYHLTKSCRDGDNCQFDHEPVEGSSLRALELLARSIRCPKGGRCRDALCTKGHVCQTQDCKHFGGKGYCRLPWTCHKEDYALARTVYAQSLTHDSRSSYGEDQSRNSEEDEDNSYSDGGRPLDEDDPDGTII